METEYEGEKPSRNYARYVLVSCVGLLASLAVVIILLDVPFLEEPLHEFLATFVPPDAFVWEFVKVAPVVELPSLPPAPDDILQDIVETVVDTAQRPDRPGGIEEVLDVADDIIVPLATIAEVEEETPEVSLVQDDTPTELPANDNVKIPEFAVESNRILSDDARFASVGTTSLGDSFAGIVTEVRDGNSLYVNERLLVLAGVKPEAGAPSYLAELCPVGANAIYDVDDSRSLSKDGGLYSKVWCFVPGLPTQSANQLMLESELARIDYSCIGSEFGSEDWVVSAGCPG